ncbi:MAG: hypothetical protein ABFS23_11570 [Pseudomonadota bacterium]
MLLFSGNTGAEEHKACTEIHLEYDSTEATELRQIAESCEQREVALLYYNRAYHKELLQDLNTLSGMQTVQRSNAGWHPDIHRNYIALVELFTPIYAKDSLAGARILNAAYGHALEIAELRLRGYDRIAAKLEAQPVPLDVR